MKRLFLFLTVLIFPLTGCNNASDEVSIPVGTSSTAIEAVKRSQRIADNGENNKRLGSPIELAQKEYLAAYDNYVRLLRESGPQTIDTLQALAEYQKKYQLYQMLLKAENDD